MVGVFGILAYSVQQRVRDFGVRRALGATTSDVLRLVVGSAVRVVATGAAIGLVLSALCGRLIETMLFGVRPLDPTTFALVTIVLGVTAALSIAGPAWRAARIDPASRCGTGEGGAFVTAERRYCVKAFHHGARRDRRGSHTDSQANPSVRLRVLTACSGRPIFGGDVASQ